MHHFPAGDDGSDLLIRRIDHLQENSSSSTSLETPISTSFRANSDESATPIERPTSSTNSFTQSSYSSPPVDASDYESITLLRMRQAEERRRLIEEMRRKEEEGEGENQNQVAREALDDDGRPRKQKNAFAAAVPATSISSAPRLGPHTSSSGYHR